MSEKSHFGENWSFYVQLRPDSFKQPGLSVLTLIPQFSEHAWSSQNCALLCVSRRRANLRWLGDSLCGGLHVANQGGEEESGGLHVDD